MKAQVSRLRELDPHEVGRPHFRFKNPIIEGQLEYIVQALYDYYEVAVATQLAKQTLFSIPVGGSYTPAGGAAFNKNRVHTNLSLNAVLGAPNKFATKAISVVVRSDAFATDSVLFLFATQVTFVVGDNGKPYFEGLAATAPSGYGAYVADGTVQISGNGWPIIHNQQSLSIHGNDSVSIEQQQVISVTFDPTQIQGGAPTLTVAASGGTGLKVWCRLEGQLARAVQ